METNIRLEPWEATFLAQNETHIVKWCLKTPKNRCFVESVEMRRRAAKCCSQLMDVDGFLIVI